MQNIKLDERLSACAEFVRKNAVLADIGTDHAYLPVSLIISGKINSAIACDINEKPLESAKSTVLKYGVSNKISLRLCDGLNAVNHNEFSDLVIAGMGGELIVKILSAAEYIKNKKYRLILQPMTKAHVLRKYLCENGFKILGEKAAVSADKVYTVICAEFCESSQKKDMLFYFTGKLLNKHDYASSLYRRKIKNALIKQANGILTSDKNSEYAKSILKTAEKIKD